MIIKKATIEDLEIIANLFDLYRQFYNQNSDIDSAKEFLSERIKNNESEIFFALDEKNKKGMGFVQLFPAFSSVSMKRLWILNDLYVHQDYRKHGIGEALIQRSKELSMETASKGLSLETHNSNKIAQKLYDKTGFEKDNEYYKYYWK
ncbi:MAG TPA: GNAT family N-acetyltransferase [Ignavibacteria bacterium]|nr:GNAT family N-acetyltransferase [Ignavibacteria bacterium]